MHEAQAMTLANHPLITADNRDVMRGMNADPVDPIYLDPPLNSSADYSAPIGSEAAGAASKDTSTLDDSDAEWHARAQSASLLATWECSGLPARERGCRRYRSPWGTRINNLLFLIWIKAVTVPRSVTAGPPLA